MASAPAAGAAGASLAPIEFNLYSNNISADI